MEATTPAEHLRGRRRRDVRMSPRAPPGGEIIPFDTRVRPDGDRIHRSGGLCRPEPWVGRRHGDQFHRHGGFPRSRSDRLYRGRRNPPRDQDSPIATASERVRRASTRPTTAAGRPDAARHPRRPSMATPALTGERSVPHCGTMSRHDDTLEQIRRLNAGLHWKTGRSDAEASRC
jgi:hypothetical protein